MKSEEKINSSTCNSITYTINAKYNALLNYCDLPNKMIECFLSAESFCAGGTAILLLHAKRDSISHDSIILCWCHGYLSADLRYS